MTVFTQLKRSLSKNRYRSSVGRGQKEPHNKTMTNQQQKKWSQVVTKHSQALDLEPGIFTWRDTHKIALSLKRSAERSSRRKGTAYQSATSMLNFYINRAGRKLPVDQKKILEEVKPILRQVFDK